MILLKHYVMNMGVIIVLLFINFFILIMMKLYWLIKKYNNLKPENKIIVYDNLVNKNKNFSTYPFHLKRYINKILKLNETNKILFINYINARRLQLIKCPHDKDNIIKTICDPVSQQVCEVTSADVIKNNIKKTALDITIGALSGSIVGAISGTILPGPGTLIGLIAGVTSGAISRPVSNIISDTIEFQRNSYIVDKNIPKYHKYKIDLIKNPNDFYYPPDPNSLLKITILYSDNYKKVLEYTTLSVFISGLVLNENDYIITFYKKEEDKNNILKTIKHKKYDGSYKIYNFDIIEKGIYKVNVKNNDIELLSEDIKVVDKEDLLKDNDNLTAIQLIKNYTTVLKNSSLTINESIQYSYEVFNIIIDEYYFNRKYLQHICRTESLKHEDIYLNALFYCSRILDQELCFGLIEVKFCNSIINNNTIITRHIIRMKAIMIALFNFSQINTEIIDDIYNKIFYEMLITVKNINYSLAKKMVRDHKKRNNNY